MKRQSEYLELSTSSKCLPGQSEQRASPKVLSVSKVTLSETLALTVCANGHLIKWVTLHEILYSLPFNWTHLRVEKQGDNKKWTQLFLHTLWPSW